MAATVATADPDTLAECLAMQADEIIAMLSIYDEQEEQQQQTSAQGSSSAKPFTVLRHPPEPATPDDGDEALVKLAVPINFSDPRRAVIKACACASRSSRWSTVDGIAHLPPLELTLRLPRAYPLRAPPQVAALRAPWADDAPPLRDWIQRHVQRIWTDEAGQAESLMLLADWASEQLWNDPAAADESPFRLDNDGWHDLSASQRWSDEGASPWRDSLLFTLQAESENAADMASATLSSLLTHFSEHRTVALFSGSRFNCSICLESVRGRLCTRLQQCGHVFCTPCLQDFLGMLVKEGDWRGARRCPDLECTEQRAKKEKLEAQAGAKPSEGATIAPPPGSAAQHEGVGYITRGELEALVGTEALKRYDWLELKAAAELDPSATFCPIQTCGGIARGDPREAGTWSEGLRICSSCGFSFCRFCEKSWHGKAPCALLQISALIEQYAGLAEGSAEQKAFERKYGRANIQRLAKIYMEESANRAWISENSTACPACHVPITKSEGCNHMTCRACKAHFCMLCSSTLSVANPYQHFNTPGTPCYQKLFFGMVPAEGAELDDALRWEDFPPVDAA